MSFTSLALKNQAESLLVGSINNTDDPVTFSITPGDGNLKFPTTTGGKYYKVLVIDPATLEFEVMKVTGRTNDSLTAVRAQEGTIKRAFTAGAVVSVRLTAGDIDDLIAYLGTGVVPLSGATFTGTVGLLIGADVAAAATVALGIPGNIHSVTGTGVTITAFASKGVGTTVVLRFASAGNLIQNNANLDLGIDIAPTAGDVGEFYEYASGKYRLVSWRRAAGSSGYIVRPLNGGLNQIAPNTWTDINFTSAAYDLLTLEGNGSPGSGQFTCKQPGPHEIKLSVASTTSIADGRRLRAGIVVNGTFEAVGEMFNSNTTARAMVVTANTIANLARGDVVKAQWWHDHTANVFLDCDGPTWFSKATKFSIIRLGQL